MREGFVQDLPPDVGVTLPAALPPRRFDGEAARPAPASAHAGDTDEVLRHRGYSSRGDRRPRGRRWCALMLAS
jgi:hypothetical protein